ncbi:hypothetical protein BGY98DRAFT_1094600 [Russula aff. rugulosa BPL654]|nr:hypothetical protein BGY98DRAFT_1094600 [Russula aff. rugulosa BPL654]
MFDFHLRLAFKADRLARSTSRISHAFVPVAHPALKAPPPFVFRIATRPWFRRGADTPNIPLSCRYHLYHDSRIPPTPSRLGHLAPPHVTSINRGGDDVPVIRVWSVSPHAWVHWLFARISANHPLAAIFKQATAPADHGPQVY